MYISILKYGASEAVAKLAPFLTTLYVAKFLSPELFGKYSLIVVMFEIVFIVVSFNIQATTRIDYFKESQVDFNKIKMNHLAISLILTFVALTTIFFVDVQSKVVVLFLALSALLRTVSVFIQAIFQCSKRVSAYIVTNVVFALVLSFCTFVFVNLGATFYSWLYGMLVASAIQFFIAVKLYGFCRFRGFISLKINFISLKSTFIPALLFMPQAVGWWMKTGTDRLIISEALGDVMLGQYSLSFQLMSLLIVFISVLNLVLVPEINMRLKSFQYHNLMKMLLFVSLVVCMASFCAPFVFSIFIREFYDSQYYNSIGYMYPLALSIAVQAIIMIFVNVLYYRNKGIFVAKLILFAFSLQALISYFVVEHLGVYGIIGVSVLVNSIVLVAVLYSVLGVLRNAE